MPEERILCKCKNCISCCKVECKICNCNVSKMLQQQYIFVPCGNISMTEYFLAGQGLVLTSGGKCEEEIVKSELMHW